MSTRTHLRRLALALAAAGLSAAALAPRLPAQESTPPPGQEAERRDAGRQEAGRPYQTFLPDGLAWRDDPEFPGLKSTVLYGIVANNAPYTYRMWAPDGGYVGLHSHDRTEFITVLAGVLYHATGDGDRSTAARCEAGCFVIVPGGGSHQGWLEPGTILQIHGRGPIGARHPGAPGS